MWWCRELNSLVWLKIEAFIGSACNKNHQKNYQNGVSRWAMIAPSDWVAESKTINHLLIHCLCTIASWCFFPSGWRRRCGFPFQKSFQKDILLLTSLHISSSIIMEELVTCCAGFSTKSPPCWQHLKRYYFPCLVMVQNNGQESMSSYCDHIDYGIRCSANQSLIQLLGV